MSGNTQLRQAVDQLLSHRLGVSLSQYLENARTAGLSWEQIARDLNEWVGISVSFATIRRWYPEQPAEVAS